MADFTPVQEQRLEDIMRAQEQRLEDMINRVFPGMWQSTVLAQGPPGLSDPSGVGYGTNCTASWRPDELGFFDPDLQDENVISKGDIV
jgi:hypothetical protein